MTECWSNGVLSGTNSAAFVPDQNIHRQPEINCSNLEHAGRQMQAGSSHYAGSPFPSIGKLDLDFSNGWNFLAAFFQALEHGSKLASSHTHTPRPPHAHTPAHLSAQRCGRTFRCSIRGRSQCTIVGAERHHHGRSQHAVVGVERHTGRGHSVPRLTPRDVMGSNTRFLLRPTGFEGQDRSRHWEEDWSIGVMELGMQAGMVHLMISGFVDLAPFPWSVVWRLPPEH
jgi:hypothetical protein